jgi:hypothetical protein
LLIDHADAPAYYRQWSTQYDGESRHNLFDFDERTMQEIIAPGEALDAVCSTGRFADRLRELGHQVMAWTVRRRCSPGPVPPEYSIARLTRAFACGLEPAMVGWPAAQDHLPAGWPGARPVVLMFRQDLAKHAELLALRHENTVLRQNAGRIRYEPADRMWFATLAQLIPRGRWAEVFPVTSATLLAWHRKLAARKHDTSKRRKPGRPPVVRSIAHLVIRLAKENPLWVCMPKISSVQVKQRARIR